MSSVLLLVNIVIYQAWFESQEFKRVSKRRNKFVKIQLNLIKLNSAVSV